MSQISVPRPEYPRPQFVRTAWMNLNGAWSYMTDRAESGEERGFQNDAPFTESITVPFCRESRLSGIGDTDFCGCVWYRRTVSLPEDWTRSGRHTLLHIGACDYRTSVWVNGKYIGDHVGGYVSFSFDITSALAAGENTLTIRAVDHVRSHEQPAGKQCDRYASFCCSYTRTTGIWQTVWLENLPAMYISRTKYYPDIDRRKLVIEAWTVGGEGLSLTADAAFAGSPMGHGETVVHGGHTLLELPLDELHLWEVGAGRLYDLTLTFGEDRAESYFGMRKIECRDGFLYLNGNPVFQRLVLDQGFYPDGIYTAPTAAELEADIDRSLAMGFNGARLHQKVFEERFHYWADKLGYLTWGEAASWGLNTNDPEAGRNFLAEWREEIVRDRNHPSIVTWTPMNEEFWPDRVQFPRFVSDVYDITKQLDPTRPVNDVSGGVHIKTDIWSTHNYEQDPAKLKQQMYNDGHWFQTPNNVLDVTRTNVGFNRPIDNNRYDFPLYEAPNMPYILDEFGGIKWTKGQDSATGNSNASWGYGEPPHSLEEFYARLEGQVNALMELSDHVWGYTYTQLTDVEQEQNGVYFYDRTPKFDMKRIHAIFSKHPEGSK